MRLKVGTQSIGIPSGVGAGLSGLSNPVRLDRQQSFLLQEPEGLRRSQRPYKLMQVARSTKQRGSSFLAHSSR
jgi:hypothetical protein